MSNNITVLKDDIYYYIFSIENVGKFASYAILKSNGDYHGSGLMASWTILDMSKNMNNVPALKINSRISGNQLPGVSVSGAYDYITDEPRKALEMLFEGNKK